MQIPMVALILGVITLSGCATPKQWEATGGGKSDGIVQISYEQGQFENGQSSDSQGLTVATERCKFWGYKSALKSGTEKSICKTMGKYNCLQTTVTQDYICEK
ncbi:YecR family lipoprotein [Yersinia sp. 2544 StPb PI]|uniref:YecR family lipoprotein n=2 Tax=Yersinia TaxID=629 RepID=UPI0009F4BF0F|nr:hypothetical protein A6J66_010385 [Yersinia enterocolitica]HEI6967613.1 hypothetical protein [Yersinia enterocolitica]